jgi:hypothetical protein
MVPKCNRVYFANLRKEFDFDKKFMSTMENNRQIKNSQKKTNNKLNQTSESNGHSFQNSLIEEIAKEMLVDLETLNSLLEQKNRRADKLGDFQTTLRDFNKTTLEKEFHRNDYLKDIRDVKVDSEISKLSTQISFECHLRLLRSALFLGNSELFMSFLEAAFKRSGLFHFEKPYISDIVLMESEERVPMVDKNYSMINVDLNEPHLMHQIEELRGKFGSTYQDTDLESKDT